MPDDRIAAAIGAHRDRRQAAATKAEAIEVEEAARVAAFTAWKDTVARPALVSLVAAVQAQGESAKIGADNDTRIDFVVQSPHGRSAVASFMLSRSGQLVMTPPPASPASMDLGDVTPEMVVNAAETVVEMAFAPPPEPPRP